MKRLRLATFILSFISICYGISSQTLILPNKDNSLDKNRLKADPPVALDPVTDTLFVKKTPAGSGDGSSWDNAFDGNYLAWFLRNKAVDGTVIYVAAGIYKPYLAGYDNGPDPRKYAFKINNNIHMRGGFSAGSASKDTTLYDPKNNITRLTGEIQDNADVNDNSYQVVVIIKNKSVFLDGFYISDGYSAAASDYGSNGGGIYDQGGDVDVEMSHLVVENNAANYGGGLYINSNRVTYIRNTIIRNNTALLNYGGAGIFAWGNFLLETSTISNNINSSGILSWRGDMLIRNSTISGNGTYGINFDNGSFGDFIRTIIVNSTIANNSSSGIRLKNFVQDSITISYDNTLVVNNGNGDTDFSGNFPIDTLSTKYTIIGNKKYKTGQNDVLTLSTPVALANLAYNGGWGDTHELLNPCENPAVGSGDPDVLSNPLTQKDQRGVARINPPCIGAFDGVVLVPVYTTWTGAGASGDWNDPSNWNNGVPGICSHVVIPGTFSSPNYPDLQPANGALCDTIEFKMGGEVAKTAFLQYKGAKVDLLLSINRYYMIAPPLGSMYSGDYFLDASFNPAINNNQPRLNPAVWMKLYQTTNPQKDVAFNSGDWSKYFNNLDYPFNPGTGFCIWVDNGTLNPENDFTMHFPKDSTTYWYYAADGKPQNQTGSLNRSSKNKFIYESAPNYNSSTGTFDINVTSDTDGARIFSSAIVGNPFMSHLNFSKFQAANSSKIEQSYQIWGGNSFTTVLSVDNTNISTDDNIHIGPMQSFIVNKTSAYANLSLGTLAFSPDMSETSPGNGLRSENPTIANVLKVAVERDKERQSSIAIRFKAGESNSYQPQKDVWTMFANNIPASAILYSLLDKKAASIRTIGDLSEPIELGISTTKKGSLTFVFNGINTFESGLNLFLEDRTMSRLINLRDVSSYTFDNTTGDIKGRFFLKISNVVTSIDPIESSSISIVTGKGFVNIYSSPEDPIQQVDCYDLRGSLIFSKSKIAQTTFSFETSNINQQFMVIKVRTANSLKVVKYSGN